jgi:hypothetical protein
MARPSSVTTRHIADQYATQAMVVELIRYLAQSDPKLSLHFKAPREGVSLSPWMTMSLSRNSVFGTVLSNSDQSESLVRAECREKTAYCLHTRASSCARGVSCASGAGLSKVE